MSGIYLSTIPTVALAAVFSFEDFMYIPKDNDRSWTKSVWVYMHRLYRCTERAMRESGSWEKQMEEMVVYGTGYYDPEADQKRIAELMCGLKPKHYISYTKEIS